MKKCIENSCRSDFSFLFLIDWPRLFDSSSFLKKPWSNFVWTPTHFLSMKLDSFQFEVAEKSRWKIFSPKFQRTSRQIRKSSIRKVKETENRSTLTWHRTNKNRAKAFFFLFLHFKRFVNRQKTFSSIFKRQNWIRVFAFLFFVERRFSSGQTSRVFSTRELLRKSSSNSVENILLI